MEGTATNSYFSGVVTAIVSIIIALPFARMILHLISVLIMPISCPERLAPAVLFLETGRVPKINFTELRHFSKLLSYVSSLMRNIFTSSHSSVWSRIVAVLQFVFRTSYIIVIWFIRSLKGTTILFIGIIFLMLLVIIFLVQTVIVIRQLRVGSDWLVMARLLVFIDLLNTMIAVIGHRQFEIVCIVSSATDLQPGDHISVPTKVNVGYHHIIVIDRSHIEDKKICGIHFTVNLKPSSNLASGLICKEDVDLDEYSEIRRHVYFSNPFSADEVIKRAGMQVGKSGYVLFFNNCEHFARWCKLDLHQSYQVSSVILTLFSVFMIVVGVIIGFILRYSFIMSQGHSS